MDRRKFLKTLVLSGMALAAVRLKAPGHVLAQTGTMPKTPKRITQADREAAAARAREAKQALAKRGMIGPYAPQLTGHGAPGGVPDYFDVANWAFSPALKKFIDTLPGLGAGAANNLGQYIPVAVPDQATYNGCDYYEIEVGKYTEQLHHDLPPTTLRGYRQTNTTDPNVSAFHYLGPLIIAEKDRPVRIKFTNSLDPSPNDALFVPVDTTTMGAGMGPLEMAAMPMNYTQTRACIHLHGGRNIWISDGTPHQWITPAAEMSPYKKGVSVQNVPDMWFVDGVVVPNTVGVTTPPVAGATNDPGPGSQTYYFPNQQSARLLFYHDHSWGITRLNVYVGEAAGYLIRDAVELDLMNGTNTTGIYDGLAPADMVTLPADEIPLIIQDKSFVDAATVRTTDPTWNWGTGVPDGNGVLPPVTGDLWYPHVYVPAQNPADLSGINPWGRWHYGPWFYPPTTDVINQPVPNPYYDAANPANTPNQPPLAPAVPDVSMPGESFFDTMLVNGTVYPTVTLQPKSYRLRILNASNDRFVNLQMYLADNVTMSSDGRTNTEVRMVPAVSNAAYLTDPRFVDWPTDGRAGGVPDPGVNGAYVGPSWIQIGSEGGFLPAPVVIPNQPITWNMDPTTFNFGNVDLHSLLLAPAERADVIVDFSAFAGQTLIVYNDAPAAFPALDARYDYYTGAPDMRDTGGHSGPQPGFGPNTRTVMQIVVDNTTPAAPYNVAGLQAVFASTATKGGVFQNSQDPIIIPFNAYNSAYNATFPADQFARIYTETMNFRTLTNQSITIDCKSKAIHDEMGAAYDIDYGRMSGRLGVQLRGVGPLVQNFVLQNYVDPSTELIAENLTPSEPVAGDGTQIWKITHNGVDTHPIHFHLFDVQLINRVGWDGFIRLPDANELGWKDTVRISPLEDTIVALRPITPSIPFTIPDSIRPLNPAMPLDSEMGFANVDTFTGDPLATPILNKEVNFGWEYVWHCHILSHEEMDMMRPIIYRTAIQLPAAPVLAANPISGFNPRVVLTWTDTTVAGNLNQEAGFRVERAPNGGAFTLLAWVPADTITYTDQPVVTDTVYNYRVVAYNGVGNTPSNIVSAVVPSVPPLAPTNFTATVLNNPYRILLNWVDNANNETSYILTRTLTTGGWVDRTLARNTITFTDTAVAGGGTYTYTLLARNARGDSPVATVTVTIVLPPVAPSNLRVTRTTFNNVFLAWTDRSNNESGFEVQFSIDGTTWATAGTLGPNAVAFVHTGRARLTTYFYRVRAFINTPGTPVYSAWSNTVTARTL